ncbi:MAG TPA: RNA polymerase, partial [Thiothrix sp.]|nr:RNA polymerase [Thiothrix sp.]
MTIAATLQRIAEGDQQAFALIVREYQRPLFAYLGRMGFSAAIAEE